MCLFYVSFSLLRFTLPGGVARARGVTVVRHPQCKKSYEKSGNERTEKEGEIRRKTANHR